MSADIDMKSYMGENTEAAAVPQAIEDWNSYQDQPSDFPVRTELLDQPQEVAPLEPSPQELNFKALRDEVDRIKAESEASKREAQLQIDLLRANLVRPEPQPKMPERKLFDGKADDYIPDVAEWRAEMRSMEAGYQARLQELEFQTSHPDYMEVIGKHLGPLVNQKPHLRQVIEQAPNPSVVAYELAKMAQQSHQAPRSEVPVPTQVSNARRMVDNARKPATLSQAGGQAALSQADYYKNMSDSEFAKLASKHLDSI